VVANFDNSWEMTAADVSAAVAAIDAAPGATGN
jgi:hypothetical protein